MPWSGGSYSLFASYTAVSGQTISSSDYNSTAEDLRDGINGMFHYSLAAITVPDVADTIPIRDDDGSSNNTITLANLWKVQTSLTAETTLAADDVFGFYDTSATAARKVTLPNLFRGINVLTAHSTPIAADSIAIYDSAGTAGKKITLGNLIDDLTEITSIEANSDFVMLFDNSGTAVGKVKPRVLGGSAYVNAQTGTTYTLALTDAGGEVTMSNASANTATIPPNSSVAFDVGTIINVTQLGAGVTTVEGGTGVTVNGVSTGSSAITAQYKAATMLKTATNTWLLQGSIGTVT